MKKIKIGLLRKYNLLLRGLLSIIGIGAICNLTSCEYGVPGTEYGVPHATFIVKGEVQSENSSTPISNIRVIMGYDTSYTNQEGKYQLENTEFPDSQTFLIEFKDVDGTSKGEYHPKDTIIDFDDPQFSDESATWNKGSVEQELDVKLKPKQ